MTRASDNAATGWSPWCGPARHAALGAADRPRQNGQMASESFQIFNPRGGRGTAPRGLFLEAFEADRLEVAGNRLIELAERRRVVKE